MALRFPYLISSIFKRSKISKRSISFSALRMEKAMENLEKNPYFEKYADKIATFQKTSPAEFLQKVEEQGKDKRKPMFGSVDTRQYSSVLNPKEKLKEKKAVEEKQLKDIFKTELVLDKNADEIKIIWEEYHKHKDVIAATIPNNLYAPIKESMNKHPTFLFPMPRAQGYEFIMAQSLGNTVHFTPLLAFQVHKENAPECLTMVHYSELSDKGIILMRGEYDKNVLDGKEAQCLANQFQMYYNGKDDKKTKQLEAFTNKPDSFKHMELISELENLTLG